MFNFLFKPKVNPDLSFLSVDMHSHLLPGIDDGLAKVEQSVEFIRKLQELGYRKLICTPHILSTLYPNNRETILPRLDIVQKAVEQARINIKIDAAAEYMIDHDFVQLLQQSRKNDLLTIKDTYILIEMSYLDESPFLRQVVFDLQMMDLVPVLAHPERYRYYHNRFERYESLKEAGCKLQVNVLSLSGGYGPDVKKTAEKLFKNEMVDFLGTDMHHQRHLAMLQELATRKEFYITTSQAELLNKTLLD